MTQLVRTIRVEPVPTLSSLFNADYDCRDAGYITASFPIHFVLAKAPGFLRDLCLSWAERIQAQHSYASFGLLRSVIAGHAQKSDVQVYPLIQRFPGLELDDPLTHSIHCKNKIKSVNWLTVLSDDLVTELGGEAAIVRGTRRDTKCHPPLARRHCPTGRFAPATRENGRKQYPRGLPAGVSRGKKVQVDYPWDLMDTPLDIDPEEFTKSWFTRLK